MKKDINLGSLEPDIAMFRTVADHDCSLKWFALADSAQHVALPSSILIPGNQTECLLSADKHGPIARYSPHLVELATPSQSALEWKWVVRNARARPCVTIMATKSDFDELFQRLRNCSEVLMPDGDRMYLAFWDPTILGTLVGQADDRTLHMKGPVMSHDQRRWLTEKIAHWWYWDRDGALRSIPVDQTGDLMQTSSIEFTQRQVDDLVEASVPDHVLHYLEMNQPELLQKIVPNRRYEFVRCALSSGRDKGLNLMNDLVNYVCVELIYRERLHQDPIISALFNRVKQRELSFADAMELLP